MNKIQIYMIVKAADENLINTTEKAKIFIAEQYCHHHSFEIINGHKKFKIILDKGFSTNITIESREKITKNTKSIGIKANFLNKEIRKVLKKIGGNDVKLEVFEEGGVFYYSSSSNKTGGGDFAIIDDYENVVKLRNLYFGGLCYADGEKRWNKFLSNNPELKNLADNIQNQSVSGKDFINRSLSKKSLIVGEIQFGNWALAYRDFFKVLKADVYNSVDCLVYITATGSLEKMLSDSIVNFNKTKQIIEDFSKVISVPIWLIGLDLEILKK